MKKLAFNYFYFLGLALVPFLSLAQHKEAVITSTDSLNSNLVVLNDSLNDEVPIPELDILDNSTKEKLTLFKPTESSSYNLQDNELAAKFDSLWMKELVDAAPLFDEMYQEVMALDTASTFVFDLPTDTLKMRLARLNEKTPFNIEYNPSLESVIKSFLTRKRDMMERMLTISQFYFPLFEQELDNNDIPLEMKYLSIVESALNPKARSRVGATGLWQFMYGTGKEMKLDINSYVDERSDPIKSTEAACNYLNRLYRIYEDWDLALAAYNSGPGNVNKAIRRSGGQRNYWNIRRNLPRETAGYVPAFQATMYIFEYAKEHGLVSKRAERAYFETDTIHIKSLITFDQISELTGIDKEEIKILNPSYKLDVIPYVEGKTHTLRLPVHKIGKFVANEEAIYAHVEKELESKESPIAEITKQAEQNSIRYRVKEGDFLGKIAERYGVGVSQLKQWNGLRSNNLRIGQRLTVYPRKQISSSVKPRETPARTAVASNSKTHEVRSGDSLWTISRKYPGVTIENLRKWNGISGNNLKLGTKLKLCDCSS
ncbi:LysM peptidoglycan-binding domain-containing protein [Maribacter hydrothermalis]|uniref:Lytic transglycosylase n=1 Tax=Maribacter hydrothermalis TaxID=1836467 RepID=A0A1B7ZE27_9FLAO|nr:LysM peptidoglycan-binding domain-containing protein [Maribacter hydrothermalis]APQ17340.1 lytic transglycosylase [Maribacter hydrothermalis]OBR41818.1 lytic transglycosylase [Maribacter hydrothermalis]